MTARDKASGRIAWHIVTCEYPPRIGGVSDHTRSIARGLAARGDDVHVWTGAAAESDDRAFDPSVHLTLGRFSPADCLRTGRLMNQKPAPRRLFVQWVPHGYGAKAMNVWFAAWLAARAWIRRDELHLMVHEPYMELSARPAETVMAIVQRVMFALVCSRAAHVWLGIPAWRDRLRRYVPSGVPMEWLPVPACGTGRPDIRAVQAIRRRTRADEGLLIGHFSTYAPPVRPLLSRALATIIPGSTAHVLLVGRGAEDFRESFIAMHPALGGRVHAVGVVRDDELTAHLTACDLFIQPYPDGISARRTSALLPLALGRAVVTNRGRLTESFWAASNAVALADSPDASALTDRAIALLTDAGERARLGARATALYDQRFDIRHAVAQLEQAV